MAKPGLSAIFRPLGRKIFKHLKEEKPSDFVGLEHSRRPPTNLDVRATTKFGRSTGGYYAERYPSKLTCKACFFSSLVYFLDKQQ